MNPTNHTLLQTAAPCPTRSHAAGFLVITLVCAALHAQTPVSTPSSSNGQETVSLDVFTVRADPVREYGSANVASATRIAAPAENIPQSVSVITAALLRDVGAFAYEQGAIRYTPGLTPRQNTPNASIIRGFIVGNRYRNGFLVAAYETDLANIERIEVIKGPAASIAGAVESGGMVNFITKRPSRRASAYAEASIGSWGHIRGVVDATGRVGDAPLAYRFTASQLKMDSWRDLERTRKLTMMPSFLWDVSKNTQLHIELEYLDLFTPSTFGQMYFAPTQGTTANPLLPPAGVTSRVQLGRWAPVHVQTSYEPGMGRSAEIGQLFTTLTHRFNDHLHARQAVSYANINESLYLTGVDNTFYYNSAGELHANANAVRTLSERTAGRLQGDLAFIRQWKTAGAIGTSLLVGYDLARDVKPTATDRFQAAMAPINLMSPTYGLPPTPMPMTLSNKTKGGSFGYFANVQLSAFEQRFILTGGVRRDKNKARWTLNRLNNAMTNTPASATLESPMYGVTVKPVSWAAVYGVYSEAGAASRVVQLYPNLPLDDPRQTFTTVTPITYNKEVGVKMTFLNGNLGVNIARFDVTQEGAVRTQTDLSLPGGGMNVIENANNAKGLELEFSGSLTRSVSLIGGYANMKTSAGGLKPNGAPREIRGVPKNKLQLFAKYTHVAGISEYSIRGGVVSQDQVWGSAENTYRIAGESRFDLGFDYRRAPWSFGLTIENVTNVIFPQAVIGPGSNTVDPPRSVYLRIAKNL